jgi:ketosteroid isomerase-like protein
MFRIVMPAAFSVGRSHGASEEGTYRQLCELVREEVEQWHKDGKF